MCIPVLYSRIVNYKGCLAEIGVGTDDCRAVFPTNIVSCPIVGFHRKALLIGERMGCNDGICIIGFAITYGTEVTITDQTIGLPLNRTAHTGQQKGKYQDIFHKKVLLNFLKPNSMSEIRIYVYR
jgi:hypothetical protein